MAAQQTHALSFNIIAKCSTTKARASLMKLPRAIVDTPVFMPVGTQGTMKGLVPDQLRELDCRIILGNTYHLGHRPVRITVDDRKQTECQHCFNICTFRTPEPM